MIKTTQSVPVISHLLCSDSIRLSVALDLHFTGGVDPFHPEGIVSDISASLSAFSPLWMEIPHLAFDGKAKLSNQLTLKEIIERKRIKS